MIDIKLLWLMATSAVSNPSRLVSPKGSRLGPLLFIIYINERHPRQVWNGLRCSSVNLAAKVWAELFELSGGIYGLILV